MKKGFTLAEIMIVLAVIGVLTAILLPVAINSTPNENIMKFKKGHNALLTAIRELINSDKYYLDGDLGTRANGQLIDGSHDGDYAYFCRTLSDVISTKEINCSERNSGLGSEKYGIIIFQLDQNCTPEGQKADFLLHRQNADDACSVLQTNADSYFVTSDGITYFEGDSYYIYGMLWEDSLTNVGGGNCLNFPGINPVYCETSKTLRLFSDPNSDFVTHPGCDGFDRVYRLVCMDIDGLNKGEAPFSYGVRADGKIISGVRAQEWLQKSIQEKE